MGGGSRPEPPPPTPTPTGSQATTADNEPEPASAARQEAAKSYAAAYEELGKAKDEIANGKAKNAQKRFKRALESGQQAVSQDPTYHEAWNLVGYCSRKLGDYDRAFAAYDKCLALKFDYAPAREYLGEAWLEKNDPRKAHEQLVMLEKFGATEDAKTLRGQIDTWMAAHPGTP